MWRLLDLSILRWSEGLYVYLNNHCITAINHSGWYKVCSSTVGWHKVQDLFALSHGLTSENHSHWPIAFKAYSKKTHLTWHHRKRWCFYVSWITVRLGLALTQHKWDNIFNFCITMYHDVTFYYTSSSNYSLLQNKINEMIRNCN